jgi:hypothetical protein
VQRIHHLAQVIGQVTIGYTPDLDLEAIDHHQDLLHRIVMQVAGDLLVFLLALLDDQMWQFNLGGILDSFPLSLLASPPLGDIPDDDQGRRAFPLGFPLFLRHSHNLSLPARIRAGSILELSRFIPV